MNSCIVQQMVFNYGEFAVSPRTICNIIGTLDDQYRLIKGNMPFTADAIAAQQVQERLKSLQQLVHDIEKKRQQSEQGIVSLQKYAQDDKSAQNSQKLKSLYKVSITQAEQEEEVIRIGVAENCRNS
ncbi:hypothetical protein NQ318_022577 [Aromia moschata]|uniref:Uncharacterized protein n=1 Tax=Aromia moschata TaxID=1265417 RepID=A0AAV8XVW4_9CUCU|nr:hypothetical protein NQ318_022577 [Aromia moschata]